MTAIVWTNLQEEPIDLREDDLPGKDTSYATPTVRPLHEQATKLNI